MTKSRGFAQSTENSGRNSGKKRGRIANLKPWKPGQSGNPGGRPKDDTAAEIARAIFDGNKEEIYKAMAKALFKGNPKVFTALADRGFGKPQETAPLSATQINVHVYTIGEANPERPLDLPPAGKPDPIESVHLPPAEAKETGETKGGAR